jgi:hypothetical protein
MDFSKPKLAWILWLSGTLLIHLLLLWDIRDLVLRGYPDFTIYYTAGTMVRQGAGRQIYDPEKQFEVQQEFAPGVQSRLGALPFNHPPFEAALFVPFSFLSYRSAYLLWGGVNLTILAALPICLRPYLPVLARLPSVFWTLASLAFFPVFIALLQGQDTILLLLVYALAFISLQNRRFWSAGSWLACGLFKFHLVLPFLVLLLVQRKQPARRMKIAYGFAAVALLLFAVSIAIAGVEQTMSYPRQVLRLEATGAGGSIQPSDMPNLRGLLSLAVPHLEHLNWLVLILSVTVFLIAAWFSRLSDLNADGMAFAMSLFATILVSYHCLGHDLAVLMLPLLVMDTSLRDGDRWTDWKRSAIVLGSMALVFSPLQLALQMRYHRLAWIGLAVLACFAGLAAEIKSRSRQVAVEVPHRI